MTMGEFERFGVALQTVIGRAIRSEHAFVAVHGVYIVIERADKGGDMRIRVPRVMPKPFRDKIKLTSEISLAFETTDDVTKFCGTC
jgi:hypothetical protein